jgi:predicted RecA/RadA family phage recombinase
MKATYRQTGDSIDHTPSSAIAAGDVVVLGSRLVTIAKIAIEAGRLGALATSGLFLVAKDDSDIQEGDPLFWDADGDPVGGDAGTGAFSKDSALGPFAGWATADAGVAAERVQMDLHSTDGTVSVARAALVQDDLQPYPIPIDKFRVWDEVQTIIGTPGNDDLGIVDNTFLTGTPSIETGDVKAGGATSRKTRFQFAVPPEYVAGQTITLRANAGMKTTVADNAASIDFEVVRHAAPNVDICATAAQSINNLAAANKDFTLTPTNVVPGDILDVVCTVLVDDDATGTAVIGKVNSVTLLLDIKG